MYAAQTRGNVIVVDDDEGIRETLRDVLNDEGYTVIAAANGREALAIMPNVPEPRVALVDLLMPGMDGWELVEAMNQDPRIKMPIIVLSGMSGKLDIHAERVVEKPYRLEFLLELLQEYCGGVQLGTASG